MKALDYENFTIATEQMIMLHFKEAEKMTENGNMIVSYMNYHMATGVFNLWFQCMFLSESIKCVGQSFKCFPRTAVLNGVVSRNRPKFCRACSSGSSGDV
ncbi:hypothetical protein [Xenorhabdus bovienii]|uniref:Uncharacterized protein n=1 Tax=Xenorhabdus bovienii str. feltiae Moldova TaxID=1398200 RepID=A0A077NNX6_XENBV|nr:hypothetical protein [Xenorhabdus bovienii]CDH00610.1 hypothetical protein XBFM1_1720043 [Xenorhabdus bovienii str. feltiae Moldova]